MRVAVAVPAALEAFVEDLVSEQLFSIGLQLSVRHGGRACDLAVGLGGTGQPLTTASRLRVFCAGKPIVALAALAELARVGCPLDTTVAALLPTGSISLPAAAQRCTVRDLLQHATKLLLPHGMDVVAVPTDDALAAAVEAGAAQAALVAEHVGYSEVGAWFVLDRCVTAATGRPFDEAVRALLDGSLGLTSTSFGGASDLPAEAARIEPNVMMAEPGAWVPLLSDRSPRHRQRFSPSFGGFGTAADLAHFYELLLHPAVLGDLAGPARAMPTDVGPRRADATLATDCRFGLGLMVDLADFRFGSRPSPGSFGHSGFVGSTFGFADPAEDLAVGCIVVGISDVESGVEYLRPALVNAVYDGFVGRAHGAVGR